MKKDEPMVSETCTGPDAGLLERPKSEVLGWVFVGVLGLILIVLLFVYFLNPARKRAVPTENRFNNIIKTLSPTPEVNIGVPLSTSDEISDIEKDISNSDFSSLDSELSSIEKELLAE